MGEARSETPGRALAQGLLATAAAPGWTAALWAAACGSTHMKKQWAAVRTHCASMMVPAADVDGPILHTDLPGPLGHGGFLSSNDPARNPLPTGWRGEQV